MDNPLPFGYTHRQKRSHEQMEGNAGPAWSFQNLTPFTRIGVPREQSLSQETGPSHANRREASPPPPDYYAATGYRARTPDATARTQYTGLRGQAAQPTDRPTSASAAHPRVGGRHLPHLEEQAVQGMASRQPSRFEGDGFDMRRPVGWHARAEDHGRAAERHLVEISDGDDDDSINFSGDGADIAAYNDSLGPQHEIEEVDDVVDLTEDDDPADNWQPRNGWPMHNAGRVPPQPPGAGRPPNNDAPRLPRGMDGIINLDNGEEAWAVEDEPIVLEPSSPDIQFVSARRLDPPPLPPRRNDSDGDDVQFLREQPLSEHERRARQHAAQHAQLDRVMAVLRNQRHNHDQFTHLREEIDRAHAHIQRASDNMHRTAGDMRHGGPVPPPRIRRGGHIRMGVAGAAGIFIAPTMNFGVVGFDMGYGGPRAEPPPPTYEAPGAAPEGFTRNPAEDDVLVCPNCDSELCQGDNDIKKQVWIAKQCGHIYCGECTANRSVKRSAKGKEKQAAPATKPFKDCVVEGCGKKVSSSKAMFQVYMS